MNTKVKYTKVMLQEAAANSCSVVGVVRYLGLKTSGSNQNHIKARLVAENIDMSHFTGKGWNRGGPAVNRHDITAILVLKSDGSTRTKASLLRRALIEAGVAHECLMCKNSGTWQDKPMTLEVDHIDGNWLDNTLGNLRFLCPNCHSQCDTNKSWRK